MKMGALSALPRQPSPDRRSCFIQRRGASHFHSGRQDLDRIRRELFNPCLNAPRAEHSLGLGPESRQRDRSVTFTAETIGQLEHVIQGAFDVAEVGRRMLCDHILKRPSLRECARGRNILRPLARKGSPLQGSSQ